MRVKVISDGTPEGTRIELPSGDCLGGVKWIQITLAIDQTENEVVLGLSNVPIEIVANARIHDQLDEIEETWVDRE